MLAVASAASRRWRPGLLQFWAALVLGTLLAGCGDSAAPPPSPREDTAVQQPVLRPRAAKPTATVTSAPPLAPSLAPASPVATAAPVRETTPESRQNSTAVVVERSETVREGTPEPSIFTSVSTGKDHTCALLPDGEAYCWGPNNDDGHLDIPPDTRFLQISAGHRFTCGIRVDHGITCWGNNNHKKLEAPDGRFTALDTGWDHACALGANGTVCWGWNANERAAPPPDFAFTAIAAGAEHSCGLTINGDLRCWGKNDNGRADFQEGPIQGTGRWRDAHLRVTCGRRSVVPGREWPEAVRPSHNDFRGDYSWRGPHVRNATGRHAGVLGRGRSDQQYSADCAGRTVLHR